MAKYRSRDEFDSAESGLQLAVNYTRLTSPESIVVEVIITGETKECSEANANR